MSHPVLCRALSRPLIIKSSVCLLVHITSGKLWLLLGSDISLALKATLKVGYFLYFFIIPSFFGTIFKALYKIETFFFKNKNKKKQKKKQKKRKENPFSFFICTSLIF